jgi:hypothetical protein
MRTTDIEQQLHDHLHAALVAADQGDVAMAAALELKAEELRGDLKTAQRNDAVRSIGGIRTTSTQQSVYDHLMNEEWAIGQTAAVPMDVAAGLHLKAIIDEPDDAAPRRLGGILPEPSDSRYVYPRLPIEPSGDATSIQALVSTGRSLSGDVADISSVAEKSQTDSGTTLATYTMQRAATVSGFYSNSIVDLPAFRQLVNDDLTTAYRQALDAYVVSTITTGAGTTDDDDASDGTLVGKIRVGQQVVQDAGLSPDLVILGSADALALDLLRSAVDGQYLLDPSPRANGASPLFGMAVVVGVGVTDPVVLDTTAVQVYLGPAIFAADTTTEFSTNQSRFRLESPCLCVVRQPDGVYVVAAAS